MSGKGAFLLLTSLGKEALILDEGKDRSEVFLEDIDQIVLSPGVPLSHPIARKAKEKKIEVIGEIELGFRRLKNRAFGITGSNGKTTTALLTEHILRFSGKKALCLGNVGKSLCERIAKGGDSEEVFLIELSSFQLETTRTKALEIALVLNITPNHLDRHLSMEEYVRRKKQIAFCLKKSGEFWVSEQVARDFSDLFGGEKIFEKEIAPIFFLRYTGPKMAAKQTLSAAYLLCKRCGVEDEEFLEGLKTFKSPPHRMQKIAEIDGVCYYDDSKSSNVHSVIHAVEKIEGPLVLIVGGMHKGSSYQPWISVFLERVRKVIAYGQAAPLIKAEIGLLISVEEVVLFEDAVSLAKKLAKRGETVLLSAGCSSYDQFENYQQRGDVFQRLVKGEEWTGKKPS